MLGLFLIIFGDPWVTVLSDPRWTFIASARAEGLRSGGGGLIVRLETLVGLSDLFSDPGLVGQANLSIHLRFGGEAALVSGSLAGTGAGGGGVFLLPHAKLMHRLRPSPSSTLFSSGAALRSLDMCPTIVGSRVNTFSVMDLGMAAVIAVGGSGGLTAGLATLWPSSLVSSAVEATLGLLHVDCVLRVRGGGVRVRLLSSSSVCSVSECNWRVNSDSLRLWMAGSALPKVGWNLGGTHADRPLRSSGGSSSSASSSSV